jgi:hypothetical protein
MSNDQVNPPARRDEPVIEPEVLESLEEAERSSGSRPGGAHAPFGQGGPFGPHGTVRPMGCAVGPGCGCIGLPLALLAGAVVSALMALLWLLSLGRVPVSVVRLAQQLRQRRGRG